MTIDVISMTWYRIGKGGDVKVKTKGYSVRITFRTTEYRNRLIEAQAKTTGLTKNEVINTAVDSFFAAGGMKKKRTIP